uniref:Uncharacterized protein n=1 Tax=Parascaris univalens TaxID=6257 RepID=A0A915B9L8_PARUN
MKSSIMASLNQEGDVLLRRKETNLHLDGEKHFQEGWILHGRAAHMPAERCQNGRINTIFIDAGEGERRGTDNRNGRAIAVSSCREPMTSGSLYTKTTTLTNHNKQ